ncbi:DNA cytosine methyltransferase [soil metagenome]
MTTGFTFIDLRAGAGSQSLGLERAGFRSTLAIEEDADSRATIATNRSWRVLERLPAPQSSDWPPPPTLVAANLSSAGVTVASVNRHMQSTAFGTAIDTIELLSPSAVLLENVAGYLHARHRDERQKVSARLQASGYQSHWRLIDSAHHGLPQSRRRVVLVALKSSAFRRFDWPAPDDSSRGIGEALLPFMAAEGWAGAAKWAELARGAAPTIVGGSKRHGGADLGPTRAKAIWYSLGVDPRSIADAAPSADALAGSHPRLTNQMIAALQGFPPDWIFVGRKTSVYRQIAGAFPAPTAEALGRSVRAALETG